MVTAHWTSRPRLVLSFLSVDLAESTETLARLDEPRTETAGLYRSIVRTAVALHGGREITTDGDRIAIVFPAPTDAVACAVAIHSACEWHNRGTSDRLDVRMGIQLGESDVALDSRRLGSLPAAAAEAGRLSDAASGGQILVSDLVSSVAQARGVAFERTGLLGMGSAAHAISTFEARLTAPLSAPVQLPAQLLDLGRRTPFVGRQTERDQLHSSWTSTAAGRRRLAVVMGEPGIGKSRLAMEFARRVHAEGGLVLWGRSFEEAVHPYQPFVEMLSQYFTGADPHTVAWLPGDVRRQLARLVPEASIRGGAGAADVTEDAGDRHRMFEAVNTFVSRVSIGSPVLLVLDDLQWADPSSLLLLKSLVLDRRAASLMVLGVYRDTDVPPSHVLAQVLADIERERHVDHVALGGLDVADVAEMLRAVIRSPMAPDTPRSVWEDTAGNPYFAEELIHHVGALWAASDQSQGGPPRHAIPALGVPSRVRDRLGRRLLRLSAPTREALAVAAVIGPRFGLGVLGEVLSADKLQLVMMMDEAVRARLVSEVADRMDRYGFRHPIVRRVLLEQHTANRRALIQTRIMEALDHLREEHRTGTSRHVRHRTSRARLSPAGVRGRTPTNGVSGGGLANGRPTCVPAAVMAL